MKELIRRTCPLTDEPLEQVSLHPDVQHGNHATGVGQLGERQFRQRRVCRPAKDLLEVERDLGGQFPVDVLHFVGEFLSGERERDRE